MDAQQAGSFDKKAFIAAVKAAIEAKSPKTLKEADNYKESGKAGEVKGEVKGLVTQGKEGQAKDIETATEAPPDQSKAVAKPVTPMGPEQPGHVAADPGRRRGAEAGAGRAAQPRGRQARRPTRRWRTPRSPSSSWRSRTSRSSSRRWPTRRPPPPTPTPRPASSASRRATSSTQGKTEAAAETTAGVAGMQGAKGAALAKLVADKGKTKSKDEAKRAEVTAKIQSIFAATEADVKKILDGIDPKVEKEFETGRGRRPRGVRDLRRGEDVGVQGGPVRRLARRPALGQGQVARDARQGQRVLRGRPRALPQEDGRRHLAGRRHRRQRPDRGEAADRHGQGRDRDLRQEPARPTCRRSAPRRRRRSARSSSSSRATSTPSRSRWSTPSPRSTSRPARVSTSGSRRCRPRTRAWSTRPSARSRPIINTIRELAAMLTNVLARVAGVVGDIIKHPVALPRAT